MTTAYIVAYPHPQLDQIQHCCRCRVDSDMGREDLLEQVKEKYRDPAYAGDLGGATLWKASDLSQADVCRGSAQTVYDWINRRSDDARIARHKPIVKYFPQGPHDRSLKMVDIVIVTPDILEATQGGVGGMKYVKARNETIVGIKLGPSPFDSVKSPAAVKQTLTSRDGPRYGRPSDRFGPPTALFSKPLAFLKDRLDHLESFTPSGLTLDHAFDFVAQSTDFFADEEDREGALKPILESLLPGDAKWQEPIWGEAPAAEGAWIEGIFTYLIVEMKNEQGLGGDPFLQGLVSYGKTIAQETYAPYRKWSNLPVILLAIAGNRLTVSTAIFTNKLYANELLSITLCLGPHGPDNVLRVARVFMAIKETLEQLRDLYVDLIATPNSPQPQTIALWPNPTLHPSESQSIPKLEFFAKANRVNGRPLSVIDEGNERHALYLARMELKTSGQTEASTQEVFVKFAPRYNQDAHRLLAGHNPPLAPVLHFCARVVGDMYMIIMEYIPESRGRCVDPRALPGGPPLPRNLPQVIKRDVSEALRLLHEKRWVFGDLREPNLLYLPDANGGRVLLVDFDGAGLDGEGRYSACLNPDAGLSASVERGQIMKKEHDVENFELVLERLNGWFSKR